MAKKGQHRQNRSENFTFITNKIILFFQCLRQTVIYHLVSSSWALKTSSLLCCSHGLLDDIRAWPVVCRSERKGRISYSLVPVSSEKSSKKNLFYSCWHFSNGAGEGIFGRFSQKLFFLCGFAHLPHIEFAGGQVLASLCTNLLGGHLPDILDHFQYWDLVGLGTL